jgi:hypothetical protein
VDSLILSVAIGLVFTFAVLAAVTSIVTEGIARFLGLRGEYLLRGLRMMLDGEGDFALFEWLRKTKSRVRKALGKENPKATMPIDVIPPPVATPATAKPEPKWVTQVMQHPLISPSGSQGQVVEKAGDRPLTNKQRRKLPSYVSARSFAQAVIDLVVTDAEGKTSFTTSRKRSRRTSTARC